MAGKNTLVSQAGCGCRAGAAARPPGAKSHCAKRGVFLTLDAAVSITMIFLAVLIAYTYYGGPQDSDFKSQLLRTYLQDTATVMSKMGFLATPISTNTSNTTGMRQVLRATPPSVCMQISGYGATITEGLAGYWKLNEDSGTSASDSSPNGLSGRIYGNPSFLESGKASRAITFGISDYVAVPSSHLLEPQSFTVSVWVQGKGTGQTQYVVYMLDGYMLGIDASGTPFFSIYGETSIPASGKNINDGSWHHLLGTYDDASQIMSFYFDGQGMGAGSSSSPSYSQGSLYIGYQMDGAALDDIRIYDRVLSSSEVRQIYSNPDNLIYVVDKQSCSYSGGEIQSLTIPFAYNKNQMRSDYYYAIMRAWYRGAG